MIAIDRNTSVIIKKVSKQFVLSDGRAARTVLIPASASDSEWELKQNLSLNEYDIHHIESYPPDVVVVIKHFSGFCARWLKGMIIDIGCGISRSIPLYAKNISHIDYVGLDPINSSPERDYPFLCSRVEDVTSFVDGPLFDGAIFSTSLDHIRDIEQIGIAMKRLCKVGAVVAFWIGLHDPIIIGKMGVAHGLRKILNPLSLPISWAKMIAYSSLFFPRLLIHLKRREEMLTKAIPLDDLHFHFFTSQMARDVLSKSFGQLIEELPVPGTNSVFYAVRI